MVERPFRDEVVRGIASSSCGLQVFVVQVIFHRLPRLLLSLHVFIFLTFHHYLLFVFWTVYHYRFFFHCTLENEFLVADLLTRLLNLQRSFHTSFTFVFLPSSAPILHELFKEPAISAVSHRLIKPHLCFLPPLLLPLTGDTSTTSSFMAINTSALISPSRSYSLTIQRPCRLSSSSSRRYLQ